MGGWLEVRTQELHSVGLGFYRHLWVLPCPPLKSGPSSLVLWTQIEADFS